MMNELHNMNLPLLLPLTQVQIYELNLDTKVPTYEWMLSAASRRKCLVYPMKAITINSELASRCLSGRKGAFD